jgi:hypothetical protein
MRTLIGIGALALSAAAAANGQILAHWTFEVSIPDAPNSQVAGPYAAELGANAAGSFASGQHASANTDFSNPSGNGSAESFSSNEWAIGDYYQFTTSTLGYQDITFGWDQTRSGTGPGTFDLEWSIDGVNFTALVNDYTVLLNDAGNGGVWNSGTYVPNYTFAPVLAPAALNNQPIVYFRLTNQVTPGGNAGTNRVDDVMIGGTVPGPASAALLGVAGLVVIRRRR